MNLSSHLHGDLKLELSMYRTFVKEVLARSAQWTYKFLGMCARPNDRSEERRVGKECRL